MSLLLTPALVLLGQGIELKTDYPVERALKVRAETKIELETTAFSMEVDGEPMENRWGGGGGATTERVIAYVDTVVESEDGRPTKVTRKFDQVEMTGTMGSGDRAREIDRESPLEGETVVLVLDGDDVVAALEDGEPDDPSVLQGHHLRLPLDGLLPGADVEEGDSWEPEAAGLLEAMLLDIEGALFPRPTFDGGEGGEGRGGGRGGRGGGPGGGGTGFMATAEWEIEAELTSAREDVDGLECVVIEITCEADGDLPERTFGRGGRELSLAPYAPAFLAMLRDNTYEVELTGKLYFSVAAKRPVKLELEGEFTLETGFEREREGSTMTMSQTQEGELELVVTIEEAAQ